MTAVDVFLAEGFDSVRSVGAERVVVTQDGPFSNVVDSLVT
jgi:hypothetical protein